MDEPRYVPAAGRAELTRLYDPIVALTMREAAWRPRLAAAVLEGRAAGETLVDLGAGTGTLALSEAQRS